MKIIKEIVTCPCCGKEVEGIDDEVQFDSDRGVGSVFGKVAALGGGMGATCGSRYRVGRDIRHYKFCCDDCGEEWEQDIRVLIEED